jgi:glycosyltransferase involved in cell wall biosynthesis
MGDEVGRMRGVTFVGLGGYGLPHTRVRCYHFADALAKRGFRTRVFSFKDRLKARAEESEMYGLSDSEKLHLIGRAIPSLARRRRDLLYVQKAHYHAAAALTLNRLFGRPIVLDYDDHEVGSDPYGVPLHCGFEKRWLQRLTLRGRDDVEVTRGLARRALGCVGASGALVDYLRDYSKSVVYVPTGVDVNTFVPVKIRPQEPVFLWTGVVWGQTVFEGVRTLVEAFGRVRGRVPSARLTIVGGGAWMPRVREMATHVGGITFVGEVAPREMPGILGKGSIGVFPPLPGCPWSTSKSPTKLFEYMASGLAVVAWGEGEPGQVVDHTCGILVRDQRELVEAMVALGEDRNRRETLGREARERVISLYSIDVLADRLATFLETLGVERA